MGRSFGFGRSCRCDLPDSGPISILHPPGGFVSPSGHLDGICRVTTNTRGVFVGQNRSHALGSFAVSGSPRALAAISANTSMSVRFADQAVLRAEGGTSGAALQPCYTSSRLALSSAAAHERSAPRTTNHRDPPRSVVPALRPGGIVQEAASSRRSTRRPLPPLGPIVTELGQWNSRRQARRRRSSNPSRCIPPMPSSPPHGP